MRELELRQLVDFMLQGDDESAWNFISFSMNGKDRVYFYKEILTEAMRYVGELWELNEIKVADEHIASNVCHLLIARQLAELPKQNQIELSFKGMFFCIEEEEHSLGIRMVSSLFKEHGWNTRFLGANLPVKDAIIYANRWRPEVIGISVSIVYHLPKLIQFLNEINQLVYEPEILVGGRITSMFEIENYLPHNVQIVKDLNQLNQLLIESKLCKQLFENS
ncbi:methanogenic corrinoid protein MtbC1 [Bacillus mesophilus]|uniref:Cobalamin-binding protein n=1 Tax=Bacillus mesophilus TaxID=1808955 RepID=A0A6M0Q9P3_9BACI|nr:cobalamin-dependent protein [Bacillus mesophilus]MBM7661571.1 methanogenic corrinoid protein MtbC1 [Bacillus mesophilus]NEY72240.1 cobalamin-binding protein [Bacillus mesophilus]